jgi:hypothetical protein
MAEADTVASVLELDSGVAKRWQERLPFAFWVSAYVPGIGVTIVDSRSLYVQSIRI